PGIGDHLQLDTRSPLFRTWLESLRFIAVPVCLFLLGLTRSGIVRILHIGWGAWLTVATISVFFAPGEQPLWRTPFGLAGVLAVLTLSLGLTLFSVMTVFPPAGKRS